jgi:hypothetical protein
MQTQFRRLDAKNTILGSCVCWQEDESPDVSYLEQEEFADRLREYRRGDFFFQGCWAEAEICVNGVIQTIRSGGLWGIDSDSESAYKELIEAEEKAALAEILVSLGFTAEETP